DVALGRGREQASSVSLKGGIVHEVSYERLTGLVQLFQIFHARPRFGIEPYLLTQQGDEDHADTERTGNAGEVPADCVPVGKQKEPDEPEHPDERRQCEKVHESLLSSGVAQTTSPGPECPHRNGSVEDAGCPYGER